MAEEARRAAALRERADNLVMLDDLLATLSGVLDVRERLRPGVGDRAEALRHDAMVVTTILERENRIRVHALSGFTEFPPFIDRPLPEPELLTEPWDFRIIDDLAADPRYRDSPTVEAGCGRSSAFRAIRGTLQYGVNFYSRSLAPSPVTMCWSAAHRRSRRARAVTPQAAEERDRPPN